MAGEVRTIVGQQHLGTAMPVYYLLQDEHCSGEGRLVGYSFGLKPLSELIYCHYDKPVLALGGRQGPNYINCHRVEGKPRTHQLVLVSGDLGFLHIAVMTGS